MNPETTETTTTTSTDAGLSADLWASLAPEAGGSDTPAQQEQAPQQDAQQPPQQAQEATAEPEALPDDLKPADSPQALIESLLASDPAIRQAYYAQQQGIQPQYQQQQYAQAQQQQQPLMPPQQAQQPKLQAPWELEGREFDPYNAVDQQYLIASQLTQQLSPFEQYIQQQQQELEQQRQWAQQQQQLAQIEQVNNRLHGLMDKFVPGFSQFDGGTVEQQWHYDAVVGQVKRELAKYPEQLQQHPAVIEDALKRVMAVAKQRVGGQKTVASLHMESSAPAPAFAGGGLSDAAKRYEGGDSGAFADLWKSLA